MGNRIKGGLSIFFMSIIFYMMITTKYTHALGDYILQFIGLKAWTGNYSGIHLTVIYFGVLFIISIFLVEKYAVGRLCIKGRKIFIIFIVLVTLFYSLTGVIVKNIKKNSPGLLSIGYNLSDSSIQYTSNNSKIIEFVAEFELTNYSDEEKVFQISIYRDLYIEEGFDEINFYGLDGEEVFFKLNGNQSKFFSLSQNDYNILGGIKNGGESGIIEVITLTNDKGEKVVLNRNNGFLLVLNR